MLEQRTAAGTTLAPAISLRGIDYVELYVGNAKQAANFFRSLGFAPIAYRGLETGARDTASWCVESGDVRFVFTSPLTPDGPVAEHLRLHGESVKDVALAVPDAEEAFEVAVQGGAVPVQAPRTAAAEQSEVVTASIRACGPAVHSFVSREDGEFALPGFEGLPPTDEEPALEFEAVDHVALAVELGGLAELVRFYERALGFGEMDLAALANVSTDCSALMSKVLEGGGGKVKFPIIEPGAGERRSQVEEFLAFHHGPGVQHLALLTDDIVAAVEIARRAGIDILPMGESYYDESAALIEELELDHEAMRDCSVLVDQDEDGFLLQVFTEPLGDRPTLFFELVERHGSRGFGPRNVQKLFEALERRQRARGNL